MKRIAVCSTAVIGWSMMAFAQGQKTNCSSSMPLDKLIACVNAESAAGTAQQPASATPAPPRTSVTNQGRQGKWIVSESKSKFDDSRTVVLGLRAENGIKGWLATSLPQLMVRCQEAKTEVYLVTGMAASVESGESQRHTVRLRYDEDVASSILASQSTDDKALFFPDPMSSIVRMLSTRALVVGFTPFNATPVTIQFDVSGFGSAVQSLREACGW